MAKQEKKGKEELLEITTLYPCLNSGLRLFQTLNMKIRPEFTCTADFLHKLQCRSQKSPVSYFENRPKFGDEISKCSQKKDKAFSLKIAFCLC